VGSACDLLLKRLNALTKFVIAIIATRFRLGEHGYLFCRWTPLKDEFKK
jgi:hypothetical protein